MKLCLILLSAVLLHTEAKTRHRVIGLTMCSDKDQEIMYGDNGEEMYHIDFSKGIGVMTLPQFSDPVTYPGAYEQSITNMDICKFNLKVWAKNYNKPEALVAPQSSVYYKDEVELGSKNTLICYITGFYPPQITVSWTRNDVNVTDEATLSRHYPTTVGTFNMMSHLSFTPAEGDIYTCTVEHSALDRPLTRTWDVQVALPGVGPSVFCGVGLAGGLTGLVVGTFFIVKGNTCNRDWL